MSKDVYRDSVLVALGTRGVKASDLQHRLEIGYEEAKSLIEKKEADKIIEPSDGMVVRKLLISNITHFDKNR